jgi:hypothetical protein
MTTNSSTTAKKEIGDLLVSYGKVYFLDGFEGVDVMDEERNFYQKITNAYPGRDGDILSDVQSYLLQFVHNIRTHYKKNVLDRFVTKSIEHKQAVIAVWQEVDEELDELSQGLNMLSYLDIVMVGITLLFMIRTTKRMLFIHLNQIETKSTVKDLQWHLIQTLQYVGNFLQNFRTKDIQGNMKAMYDLCDKIIDIIERVKDAYPKVLSNLNSAVQNNSNSEAVSIRNRFTQGLSLIYKESEKGQSTLIKLANVVNKVSTKASNNETESPFLQLLYYCTQVKELQNKTNKAISKHARDLLPLFPDGDVYKRLLLLYEKLSGSVRIIARVRREKQNNGMQKGGDLSKQRKRMMSCMSKYLRYLVTQKGGNSNVMVDNSYAIEINDIQRIVSFQNVTDTMFNKYFQKYKFANQETLVNDKYRIDFGPFFAVHTSVDQVDHILNKSLNINAVIDEFETSTTPVSIILYVYGYSGSGKTYTLFGNTGGQDLDRENGILWRIVSALEKQGFVTSLENATNFRK